MGSLGDNGTPPEAGLFAPGEFRLRVSSTPGRGRGRGVSGSPTNSRQELKRRESLHTMKRLRRQAELLVARFGLEYRSLDPEREGVNGHYGICYEDGVIRIRLRHATTGRLLKESSLVDTLCHELAHLRYLDHSIRFKRLYLRILGAARELGFYRPGPLENRPLQLGLFGTACGTAVPGIRPGP